MNSAQESKQELEAAIRYAENAISSANKTIESMEFRQEMAKKQFSEQTGREAALNDRLMIATKEVEEQKSEIEALEAELQRQQDLGQGYYDSMVTLKEERDMLEKNVKYLRDENERLKSEVNALEQPEKPTMPVIPKAVAIAIFREGVQHGVEAACTELEGQRIDVEESDYVGSFEVSFSKIIDLDDELDLDWMRGKCGDYSEETVIDALGNLCADKEFECRIHGVDDQEEKKND